MEKYSKFKPTNFDPSGLAGDENGISDFWVLIGQNRDSGPLDRANFETALEILGGESESVQVHRFGHWGCGWFELILVQPGTEAETIAESIERALENYPVLNDEKFSEYEQEEAQEIWQNCFDEQDRIEYIRKNRVQFEFRDFTDLLSCVRGNHFAGYASELIA